MAKKIPKPFITRIQAEGTSTEKALEKEELLSEARKLAAKMPGDIPNQTTYVRNLVTRVHRNELDINVFQAFLRLTNAWDLFYSVEARARLIAEGQRSRNGGR